MLNVFTLQQKQFKACSFYHTFARAIYVAPWRKIYRAKKKYHLKIHQVDLQFTTLLFYKKLCRQHLFSLFRPLFRCFTHCTFFSVSHLLLKYYCPLATSLIPDLTCSLVEVSGSRTFDWSCPVLFLLIAEVFGTSGIPAVRSIRLLCIRQRTLVEPPWTPGGNA